MRDETMRAELGSKVDCKDEEEEDDKEYEEEFAGPGACIHATFDIEICIPIPEGRGIHEFADSADFDHAVCEVVKDGGKHGTLADLTCRWIEADLGDHVTDWEC